MATSDLNAQQAAYWNEIGGPHWVEQQQQFDLMLAEFGQAATAALQLGGGERVIDIGCGTGTTTLALGELVGEAGSVLGCDISTAMIEAARVRAEGNHRVSFDVLDVQTEELAPADLGFDAVFSRFGVMFFSDPTAAFANIAAHTVSGGRLAFCCWAPVDRNPWMSVLVSIMRQFAPEPLAFPANAPGPFAFSDPDRVRSILSAAGWSDINIEPHVANVTMGGGRGVDAAIQQNLGTSVGQALRQQLDEATFEVALAALRAELETRLVDGAVVFEGTVWIVTATKNGG